MARKIHTMKTISDVLPLTANQIYKLLKHPEYPLPFKKCGKVLLFDEEKIFRWFDLLPGQDGNFLNE